MSATLAANPSAAPGTLTLRVAPAGLPDVDLQPPTIAESGDPFSTARILHLVARLERGRPIRLDDIVAASTRPISTGCSTARVVADALVALQANWLSDYRNASGIVVEDGPYGPAVTIEDSSRVDPWIVRQVAREVAECRTAWPTSAASSGSPAMPEPAAALTPRAAACVRSGPEPADRRAERARAASVARAVNRPRPDLAGRPPVTCRPIRAAHLEELPMTIAGFAIHVLVDADWAKAHLDDPNVRFVEVDVDTTAYEQSHIPGAVGWNWTSQLVRRHPPRHRQPRGLLGAPVGVGHRARTRPSSCTATTTTGSPRGRTGSSSCTATPTSGSSTAAASSGWTTACRCRPTCRRTRRRATSSRSPTSRCARSATTSCRASATRAHARGRPVARRVQRRDHRASGHERDRPAGRPHPGRRVDPVGPDGQRGRHVQGRGRARALYEAKGVTPDKDVIAYCRIGERSSHSWFVLHELLGYRRVRNYDGSWTE